MPAVELNKASIEALKAEAHREMTNAISERFSFRGQEEGERQERILLACADVLGALERGRLDFNDFDHRPEAEHREIVRVELTDGALEWMKRQRAELPGYLDELDAGNEGDRAWCARHAFLLHVLDRVLGQREEAMAR